MAFSFNTGSGQGRRRFHGSSSISEINVTPFVDVVLVLLIIFMLTAHVMEYGIEVDVPKVRQVKDTAQELPVINVTKDGSTYLNDKPVNINEIATEVHRRFGNAKSVYLRADKGTVWDSLAQVMSALNEAKLGVNVVTQPEDQAEKRRR